MTRKQLLKLAVAGTVLAASTALGMTSLPVGPGAGTLRGQVTGGLGGYPRLFANGSHILADDAATMARWDVWGMMGNIEADPHGRPNIPALKADFQLLYNQNPNLKILIYADAIVAVNYEKYSGLTAPAAWGLKDSRGAPVMYGVGQLMNASDFCPVVNGQQWSSGLASVLNSVFWQQGCGNGFQFDDIDLERITSYPDVDLDNNGVNDFIQYGAAWVQQHWQNGLQNLAAQCRSLMGPNAIFVGNGDANAQAWFNGRTNEGWNGVPFTGGWPAWLSAFNDYMNWNGNHYGGNYFYVGNPEHGVGLYDYRSFRFYLTTCLMGDGLFSWYTGWDQYTWFDEYSVNLSTGQATGDETSKGYLGQPLGSYEVLGNGVYRRDYTNGLALCNPTGSAQTMTLETNYQHIKGSQDPSVNNGQIVSSVVVPSQDGTVLLRIAH